MCGIVGYIGSKPACTIIMNGLKRLEYRGYDSAGIATIENGILVISKRAGKVADLEKIINPTELTSTIGIGHTRWATHGEPNDINAHPHSDFSGNITIIHNGIIENYLAIKKKLLLDGYSFKSETDSEVLAVFIGDLYKRTKDLEKAVRLALTEIDGTFGLVVMSVYEPNTLIAARRGSPIVFGIGEDEYIIASDASAIIQHTRQVIYLEDNEMVVINREGYTTKTIDNQTTNGEIHELEFDLKSIEKGGFEHFMLKEIYEQPSTFRDAIRGRLLIEEGNVKLGGLRVVADKLRNAKRLIIIGCGTSWHSGLVGEYMIERLAQIPVEVEYASEFRYRSPIIYPDDVVIAISQSGETADTYAALREAKLKGATVLGIVNVVGSSIARETDAGVYSHAGPEIGVASTKAFTSQLAVLSLLALYLGRLKNVSSIEGKRLAEAISAIPEKIQYILDHSDSIKAIAKEYAHAQNFLYLGRGYNFPVALEGALKLKEISYIHAEGYPAAEMKHGPIALIDDNMPVVFIATKDDVYDKILSGIEEVRARKGKVIAIASEGDTQISKVASHVIYVPNTLPMLMPILSVIPLQLLSYYTAVERGCNVDMPRNLAKSVTVE
ncbi:MAG: glutamine--fructose-6-phosphate transaminase (isomerizing) [Bacteroidetes bacterium]|nr:glutamine--fructose-6-phosphate transaminase (isomerizing) [Bacteroidota bacterium]